MMKQFTRVLSIAFFFMILSSLGIGVSNAQERAFTLPWSVIGSGGMGGTADGYTIHSTLGQPVAGSVSAEPYHLTSGFWTEFIESITEFFNFLPLILR